MTLATLHDIAQAILSMWPFLGSRSCCCCWSKPLASIGAGDVGFHRGRPLAAMVIFRCCLQWKAFQADRTSLFDKIINTMGTQVGKILLYLATIVSCVQVQLLPGIMLTPRVLTI